MAGGLLTEESEVRARWTSYFERLYQADPPAELDVRGVAIPIADPPINCDPPSFVETQDAVNRLKWGKSTGICGIHARGCSRLISISRRWGWAKHLPVGWPDGDPWSTSGKWMQQRATPSHAPDLT